jgi:hypothetical protein
MSSQSDVPVHSSLTVLDTKEIYRTEEWWKAVVRYQYESGSEYDETAVYLWHKDGDWNRKNKYVIKTADAWRTDRAVVEQLFSGEVDSPPDRELPVSDYYEVGAGETVFRSSDWWKAILKIVQKGSYETEEIMIYLWQEVDDEWRRRQKYTIKDRESWEEERAAVESILENELPPEDDRQERDGESEPTDTSIDELEQLNREMDKHLSQSLAE